MRSVRIKQLQEFLKLDHWLRRYCLLSVEYLTLSHPVCIHYSLGQLCYPRKLALVCCTAVCRFYSSEMYGLFHYLLFLCGSVFFWFCLLYSYTCIQLYLVKQNFKISSSDTSDVHQFTPF